MLHDRGLTGLGAVIDALQSTYGNDDSRVLRFDTGRLDRHLRLPHWGET